MYSNAPTADANVANNFYLKVPELSKTMVKNSFLKKTKMTCDSRDLIRLMRPHKSFVQHAKKSKLTKPGLTIPNPVTESGYTDNIFGSLA